MTLPPGAPSDLTMVLQRFAQTSRGVVGFHVHRTMDVHAGFSSRHEDLVLEGIYVDGAIVKIRVATYTIDGKPAGPAAENALQQTYEHPKPGEVFNVPFDPRYADAYQYASAGPQKIAFTSKVQDSAHGDGSLTYDADGDVVSYTYRPNVLPPHATSGQVTDHRAEVLPGYWALTQETHEYKGSYGPFAGAGTVQIVFSGFQRFADLPSALRSL